MRPRTEIAIGLGVLIVLGAVVASVGRRRNQGGREDPRHSSYLSSPQGAKGLSQALERLGVTVERLRRRSQGLHDLTEGSSSPPLLILLDPALGVVPSEAADYRNYARGGDLLLAGDGAEPVMRCYGFAVESRFVDSVRAVPPGQEVRGTTPWVGAVLRRVAHRPASDSLAGDSAGDDGTEEQCGATAEIRVDTLLITPGGRLVAIRLPQNPRHRDIVLAADAGLFANRAMRDTDAGVFALQTAATGHRRVIFDEYHQGFSARGHLLAATVSWSLRSPWGWAAWQLTVVGLIALLASGIRFGPTWSVISRRRRSPLEHVRALATALAAAHGHGVAIETLIGGLRRRLSSGAAPRGDAHGWLETLVASLRSSKARAAARTLLDLTARPEDASSVLVAAHAVEDVWEELRP